ncbi:MAG: hypothetical protein ACI37O_01675 [Candidatus Avelusimicrobium sp.]|uniref:hypothetical protein n=1 Tax=Candidatus Avelusimicrobium sp. TaxID=3048833 RepID=UPI003F0FDC64
MKKTIIFFGLFFLFACSTFPAFESQQSKEAKKKRAEDAAKSELTQRFEFACKAYLMDAKALDMLPESHYREKVAFLERNKTLEKRPCYSPYDYKTDNDVCIIDMTQNPCYVEYQKQLEVLKSKVYIPAQ